ncbi:hypothetical protein MN608_05751 [Microdochium nivale]|nr:hypothetical protein MN608_05751 [Microdochium nivale]
MLHVAVKGCDRIAPRLVEIGSNVAEVAVRLIHLGRPVYPGEAASPLLTRHFARHQRQAWISSGSSLCSFATTGAKELQWPQTCSSTKYREQSCPKGSLEINQRATRTSALQVAIKVATTRTSLPRQNDIQQPSPSLLCSLQHPYSCNLRPQISLPRNPNNNCLTDSTKTKKMCGASCDTPRPSLGGALVVLRPPPPATVRTSHRQDASCHELGKDHAVVYFPPSPPLSPGREAKQQDYLDSEAVVTTTYQTEPVSISGSLVFHNLPSTVQGSSSSSSSRKTSANLATHMTFTPVPAPDSRPTSTIPWSDGSKPAFPADNKATTTTTTYMLQIHTSGNLLDPAGSSPVLHTLSLTLGLGLDGTTTTTTTPRSTSSSQTHSEPLPEPELEPQQMPAPLEIGVGGDGIIGRRVTVWHVTRAYSPTSTPTATTKTRVLVAEGIIGFN